MLYFNAETLVRNCVDCGVISTNTPGFFFLDDLDPVPQFRCMACLTKKEKS
jgi:hypothetical protein